MELREDERIDQLMQSEREIIQSPSVFSFSLDALLLGDFAAVPSHHRASIVDLCSGNGVVPLLLSAKTKSPLIGIELQERLADMAVRSVALNELESQITIIQDDLANALKWVPADSVDVVTCNPPYFPVLDTSHKNPNSHLAIARHELYTNLEQVFSVTSRLLKMNGRFFLVHRPDRFLEIMEALKKYRLAPKKIRFVYPKKSKEANVLLVEAIKDGKPNGFRVLPPLIVHTEENDYTEEIKQIVYGKE